jgi:hypothetical protein
MSWRFWDLDGDGVKTAMEFFTILRIAVYIACGAWASFHPKEYTDIQYIGTLTASFGAGMFEIFLLKWTGKNEEGGKHSDSLHSNFTEGEG